MSNQESLPAEKDFRKGEMQLRCLLFRAEGPLLHIHETIDEDLDPNHIAFEMDEAQALRFFLNQVLP
jgi:hypothetical protein